MRKFSLALLAASLSVSAQAAMTSLDDGDLQEVTGQDGISVVLSDNYGFRIMDIPAVGSNPAKSNSLRFTAPRTAKYSGGGYVDMAKDYVELVDFNWQSSKFAPVDDPIKLDLVTLGDGRAAIEFRLPNNVDGLGKLNIGGTLRVSAPIHYDSETDISLASDPTLWTIGRLQINDLVQKGTRVQLSPAGDGFGWAVQTEMHIGEISLNPRFTRDAGTQDISLIDDEWWKLSGISICGTLTGESCTAGTQFKFGDSVAGAMVVKAEQVDGKPTLTLTMGNVNVQAHDGATPLAAGSISVDSVTAKSARCAGGACDFGKQLIGDMKIYSMRVKLRDL